MKGLLLKDLLALKKQGKLMLVLVAFYAVYSYAAKNTSMLGTMLAVICTMLPITTLSYDEYNKWDRYALSMPINRKTIVISKYLIGILLNFMATIIVAVINLVLLPYIENADIVETLLILLATSMATILILAILMPLIFRFGVEKARLMLMAIFAAPIMIIILLNQMNIPAPDEGMLKMLAYASPVIVLCLLLISINISIGIYSRKEF